MGSWYQPCSKHKQTLKGRQQHQQEQTVFTVNEYQLYVGKMEIPQKQRPHRDAYIPPSGFWAVGGIRPL